MQMSNPELCKCVCLKKAFCFNQFIPVQNKNDYLYFNSNSSILDLFSFCPVLKELPGFIVMLWMFGQDALICSF